MADTMQFDLVAPERKLASLDAKQVMLPGADGNMTVLPDHAPVMTTLRPGIVEVVGEKGSEQFIVTGGFAEVVGDRATVLAERAHPVSEVTQEMIDEMVAEAHKAHKEAREEEHHDLVDNTQHLLADMVAMGTHLGLNPSVPND
ncbi:F-type H+-transporting ATPase subunit epsilon [Rhodovulum iodosum]|uniref:ATP synthase epsilon chain n=1 Tax=Rhodovulum iodosum TaxID=68291 RepID=A0ABV3XSQ8_9RHOB|nr:F0F1 ATP synthase subunit epsilon [Rhodovulum robiginosum]RSK30686.1 F0F1 ATP synthase subunit epsilon [Rhodovulum robiginosum]